MIIYKITNKINGKVYIGQTIKSLQHRWGLHCCQKTCTALHRAIEKYGRDMFTIEQIDVACSNEELDKKEQYWIEFYNSMNPEVGYNLRSGGHDNHTISDETKRKIGIGNKNKKVSEETRKKMSESRKRHLSSEENRKVLSECRLGSKHPQARKVRCIETGEIFNCIVDAAKKYGIKSASVITCCCKGTHNSKTAGGHHWEYVE